MGKEINSSFISDEEYVRRLGTLYNQIMNLRKDDDYVVCRTQLDKFVEVMNFFIDMAEKCNGKVQPINLTPKEEVGGITATFLVFDLFGDDVKRFSQILSYCSAVTIDATTKGEVCISLTVSQVFVHK